MSTHKREPCGDIHFSDFFPFVRSSSIIFPDLSSLGVLNHSEICFFKAMLCTLALSINSCTWDWQVLLQCSFLKNVKWIPTQGAKRPFHSLLDFRTGARSLQAASQATGIAYYYFQPFGRLYLYIYIYIYTYSVFLGLSRKDKCPGKLSLYSSTLFFCGIFFRL